MSIHAQDCILWAFMNLGTEVWHRHAGDLTPEMFDGFRRDIFKRIAEMKQRGAAVDMVTVYQSFGDDMDPEYAPGKDSTASAGSVKYHIADLKKSHTDRCGRDTGARLAESGDIETALAELTALNTSAQSHTVDAGEANRLFIADLEARREGVTTLLSTGLIDLDRQIGGLDQGDLCIIGARPGMGKTALMLNIAMAAKCPAGIFSCEMPTKQLTARLIAAQGVDYGRIKHSKLTDADWRQVTAAQKRIYEHGFVFNDQGGISIGALESEAYRMVQSKGCGLICIDYLQLVTCRAESRLQEVSEISRRLKALAKNLSVPVVVLSQLNRSVEDRSPPRPRSSDLRESGQLEQDADQIIFIYRPEHYTGERPGEADLIVDKSRSTEAGVVVVTWQGQYQRFVNRGADYYQRSAA